MIRTNINYFKYKIDLFNFNSNTVSRGREHQGVPHDSSIEMSIGKLTPNDLTELALRTALFGDLNPLENQHMGFFAE